MSKLFPSLKGRPWSVYFFMAIYAVASVFTVVESALPGDISSIQSSFVGNILAWFANLFPAPEPTPVHPTGIRLLSSSSYLDAVEDDPSSNKICLGTTTMLTFDLEYPEKKENTYEYASFRAEEVKGGENYSLVVDPSSLVVRIVSKGETAEDCEIAVYGDEGVMTTFSFDIVPRPSPREFSLENVPTSVQAGTAASFDLVLSDPIGERSDYELRRYFDVSSLEVAFPPLKWRPTRASTSTRGGPSTSSGASRPAPMPSRSAGSLMRSTSRAPSERAIKSRALP